MNITSAWMSSGATKSEWMGLKFMDTNSAWVGYWCYKTSESDWMGLIFMKLTVCEQGVQLKINICLHVSKAHENSVHFWLSHELKKY